MYNDHCSNKVGLTMITPLESMIAAKKLEAKQQEEKTRKEKAAKQQEEKTRKEKAAKELLKLQVEARKTPAEIAAKRTAEFELEEAVKKLNANPLYEHNKSALEPLTAQAKTIAFWASTERLRELTAVITWSDNMLSGRQSDKKTEDCVIAELDHESFLDVKLYKIMLGITLVTLGILGLILGNYLILTYIVPAAIAAGPAEAIACGIVLPFAFNALVSLLSCLLGMAVLHTEPISVSREIKQFDAFFHHKETPPATEMPVDLELRNC